MQDTGETPAVEVRVYRDGELVHTELCESEEQAAAIVDWWEETPGVECELYDLSAPSPDEGAAEVSPTDISDRYPYLPETREDVGL